MNLDAYLARIGYAGPRSATIEVLREIILLHACSIPFENLDVLLDRGISLDDDAVERKLVHDRRGGYCFEHNSLLLRALNEIGFSATPMSARVRVNLSRDVVPPRTHLFLRVVVDDLPWLVDVGIGSLSPTAPFRLDLLDVEQVTPHEPRRIVCERDHSFPRYFHQARLGDEWVDVHEFTLEEMPVIDREVGNCWTSMHPKSKFRLNLIVGMAHADGTRQSIVNNEFTHRRGTEILERFEITHPEQLLELLAIRFRLEFAAGTRFGPPGKPWPT